METMSFVIQATTILVNTGLVLLAVGAFCAAVYYTLRATVRS